MTRQEPVRIHEITPAELALLGGGRVAYVREIGGAQAAALLGPMARVPAEAKLFALYAADGTPVAIAGSREAALANAFEHDLEPMSVH
jgi:hypothetical protein